ncbi:MAG TPA: hypothetical protein VGE74_20550 [Gemmata sp.]
MSGFVSANTFIPQAKTGIVVLSNSEHVSTSKLRGEMFRFLLKDVEAQEAPPVPKVAGVGPKEAVLGLLKGMSAGQVDRTKLGEEYSAYRTDERVKAGGARLKALGEPKKVEVRGTSERGGMEVATVALTYKTSVMWALLFRTPEGKIKQLLYYAE